MYAVICIGAVWERIYETLHEDWEILNKVGGQATSREIKQCYTGMGGKEQIPGPKRCEVKTTDDIDIYFDGSVKQAKGIWQPN